MQKRKLCNLEVSAIGVGCMGFSHGYGKVPEADYSINAMRKAFEAGCNFFDTAEVYGDVVFYPGHNEELVGKALGSVRKEVVLATKLHLRPDEVATSPSVYDAVKAHLVASMKRLATDYVDLYYLHRINEEVSFEEVAAAMGRLIEEGVAQRHGDAEAVVQIRPYPRCKTSTPWLSAAAKLKSSPTALATTSASFPSLRLRAASCRAK